MCCGVQKGLLRRRFYLRVYFSSAKTLSVLTMADDNWPPAPVDWLAVTIDESKPVTEDKPAATTDESKPVTEHKSAATTNESRDKVCQSRNSS